MAGTKYFLTSTNATTVSTARKLSLTSGTATSISAAKIAKTTGWFVMAAQGSSNTNQASEPAFGNTAGFLLDDTTLEGLAIQDGTVSVSVRVSQSSGAGTWVPHVLIGKRTSAGVFTSIVDIACTSTPSVGSTLVTITGSGSISGDTSFATGDKLYVNTYFDLTTNTSASTTATASLGENGTSDFIVVNVGTPQTKTQSAVARVQASHTVTQSAVAHIQAINTVTQSAVARLQITPTKTQTATARIQITGTKTQSAVTRIQRVGLTVTESALARIQSTVTTTQGATARVQTGPTFTQTATAHIAAGGPSFVTGSSARGSAVSSLAVAISAPAQGNLLVAAVGGDNSATSVSSLTGSGWTQATRSGTANGWIEIWYKICGAGESGSITANLTSGASSNSSFLLAEYTGIDGTTPLVIAHSAGNTSGTYDTPTVTPTAGLSVVVVCAIMGGFSTALSWNQPSINSTATGVTGRESTASTNGGIGDLWDAFFSSTSGSFHGTANPRVNASNAVATAIFQAPVASFPGSTTQTATARVQVTGTKTQTALARVQNAVTATRTAVARIQRTGLTVTQSGIARIAQTFTKTQPATARIQHSESKTQSAIARISKTLTTTQTAIARITKSFTFTQSAVARVAIIGTKTQSATARVSSLLTKTQSAVSRIRATGTKTQPAIARVQIGASLTQTATAHVIVATASTKTQTAAARIRATLTKTQAATARVQVQASFTQLTKARVQVVRSAVQGAVARVVKSVTKSQTGVARIQVVSTATQTARGRLQVTRSLTQAATAKLINPSIASVTSSFGLSRSPVGFVVRPSAPEYDRNSSGTVETDPAAEEFDRTGGSLSA